LESGEFEPLKVLEHLKNKAVNRARDQGLEFQFSKSGTIPDFLSGDLTRLAQIVNNVLSNAIKFTIEGFVKFRIDAQQKPNNRFSLIFTISDSGIGFPKEKLHGVFDSFSQNNIDNKRKFGGLGLGLYIVKTLVDVQKGSIALDSIVDKGTVCKITIDYDVVARQKEVKLLDALVYDLEGKSILVVEDNAINQMVIKMITKKWLNTTIVYANNGQEGLDAFAENQFDIALMDLQMPVMDGYEATIVIRTAAVGEANKNIPIIADVMETTKMRVVEIGMNHYVLKPIKNETLFNAIRNLTSVTA
jgi:CheY-like chemotaxis protein